MEKSSLFWIVLSFITCYCLFKNFQNSGNLYFAFNTCIWDVLNKLFVVDYSFSPNVHRPPLVSANRLLDPILKSSAVTRRYPDLNRHAARDLDDTITCYYTLSCLPTNYSRCTITPNTEKQIPQAPLLHAQNFMRKEFQPAGLFQVSAG